MIFSLSSKPCLSSPKFPSDNVDIFTYYSSSDGIDLSFMKDQILLSMMSSLRMKKGILVISPLISSEEKFDFNYGLRTYEGQGFIYIAPHALSLLRPFQAKDLSTFQLFRTLLIESKLLK